jgi:hypothetical protein
MSFVVWTVCIVSRSGQSCSEQRFTEAIAYTAR